MVTEDALSNKNYRLSHINSKASPTTSLTIFLFIKNILGPFDIIIWLVYHQVHATWHLFGVGLTEVEGIRDVN